MTKLTEDDIDAITIAMEKALRTREDSMVSSISDEVYRRILADPPCHLQPEVMTEMPHIIGVIKDLGDQDIATGAEVMRKGLSTMKRLHHRTEKVVTSVVVALAIAIVLYTGSLVWEQIK